MKKDKKIISMSLVLLAALLMPACNSSKNSSGVENYYVIKYNSVPAVLIELGFMTNSSDFSTITSETNQRNAAKAIYDAISESFSLNL